MFGFIMASAEYGLKQELGTLGICTNWSSNNRRRTHLSSTTARRIQDRDGRGDLGEGQPINPGSPHADPSLAAEDYGRDLLTLINEFVEERRSKRWSRSGHVRAAVRASPSDAKNDETELVAPGTDQVFIAQLPARKRSGQLCDGEALGIEGMADELAARFDLARDRPPGGRPRPASDALERRPACSRRRSCGASH